MSSNASHRTVTIYPPPRGTHGLPFVVVSIVDEQRDAQFADSLEEAIELERESRKAILRDTEKIAG